MSEVTHIAGLAGNLEVNVAMPEGEPKHMGLVCHPHPLHGGTMNNKVVTMLAKALIDTGGIAVRFNFRGVGKSEGEHDHGEGEVRDVQSVTAWMQSQWPHLPFVLAGFSFGGGMALKAASDLKPTRLLAVAPAVMRLQVQAPDCPWALFQGLEDDVVPADEVLAWAGQQPLLPELVTFAEAGHFFHGHLIELKLAAIDFFS